MDDEVKEIKAHLARIEEKLDVLLGNGKVTPIKATELSRRAMNSAIKIRERLSSVSSSKRSK